MLMQAAAGMLPLAEGSSFTMQYACVSASASQLWGQAPALPKGPPPNWELGVRPPLPPPPLLASATTAPAPAPAPARPAFKPPPIEASAFEAGREKKGKTSPLKHL